MNGEPIFERVCAALLEKLRGDLEAVMVNTRDGIRLSHPGAEEDFQLGVYLYDMEEVRPNGPPRPVRLNEQERRLPDLNLALRLMIFANRKVAFNAMSAEDEVRLLEASIRSLHSITELETEAGRVKVSFQVLTQAEKVSLWQSMNCPLQNAVYVDLQPVSVPSTRILRVPPVREISAPVVPEEGGARRL